ncbi:ankyrin repeat and LEM domain-containing protein 2-like [Ciona intestinalis]
MEADPALPVFVVFQSNEESHDRKMEIFCDQISALKFLTKNKNGRLMRFENKQKAQEYEKLNGHLLTTPPHNDETMNEKPNSFKSLKQAELNKLLKAIESNDSNKFDELVQNNPRYLINSGDGPVLLKPNTRYNPLHIAARSNQPEMVKQIISTLSDPDFQKKMYTNISSPQETSSRLHHILDLYFNTPEKGFFETPLHMACKFGFAGVVAELVSHPICNKTMKNKSNKTPADVVCTRASNKSESVKEEILSLLRDQYYVPLMRCHDNSEPATVGDPCLHGMLGGKEEQHPDPRKPIPVVSALLGPMSSEDAKLMRKSWMTPDRKMMQGRRMSHIRRSDMEKGDERIGRELARRAGVPWMEFWEFIGNYADFTTKDGLKLLEEYLAERYQSHTSGLNNSIFSPNDSLTDLCSQLDELKVDGTGVQKSNKENEMLCHDWWKVSTSTHNAIVKEVEHSHHMTTLRDSLMKNRRKQLSKFSNSFDFGNLERTSGTPLKERNKTLNLTPLRPLHVLHNRFNSPATYSTPIKPPTNPVLNLTSKFDELDAGSPHGDSKESNPQPGLPKPSLTNDDVVNKSLSYSVLRDKNNSSIASSISDDVFTPESLHNPQSNVFILGSAPSKVDRDVILAIENAEVSSVEFPHTWKWMEGVLSYSETDRQRWKTPKRSSNLSPLPTQRGTPVSFTWLASPLARPRTPLATEPLTKSKLAI